MNPRARSGAEERLSAKKAARRPSGVTAEEFRSLRKRLGFDRKALAEVLGVTYRTLQDWELETTPVPAPVALAVRLLVEKQGNEEDRLPEFEDAVVAATEALRGLRAEDGTPLILEATRRAAAATSPAGRVVAVLWLAVERGGLSGEDVTRKGFPAAVVRALGALRKRAGETPAERARRLTDDPLASQVEAAVARGMRLTDEGQRR